MRAVYVLAADLFFGTRLGMALERLGRPGRVVEAFPEGAEADLDALQPGLVVADLEAADWPRLLAAARSRGLPVLAFGPHGDAERIKAARAQGADRVVAKSKISVDFAALLDQYLER